MRSFAVVPLIFALVGAQSIDPNSVPLSIRDSWCVNQKTSCPLLCLQQSNSASTTSNSCDPKSLDWSCVCVNGLSPNVSMYSQTVPYYECTEFNNQCVTACGQSNNACASNCRQNHPCGAQNPERVNSSTIATKTASKSGSSATGGAAATTDFGSFGGSGGNSGSSATSTAGSGSKSAAIAAINLGQAYGLGVVVAGFFAGFALLL